MNYRMLYFFHGTTAVVVSHGFSKQQARVPQREIKLADRAQDQVRNGPEAALVSTGLKAMGRKHRFESAALQYAYDRFVAGDRVREEAFERELENAQLARKLYDLRTKAGLTQRQLANRIGTTAVTDPHPGLLDRDLAIGHVREPIETLSELLTELVNYATHALVRCDRASRVVARNDVDIHIAPFALFHHLISMTDGIQCLVRQCAGTPTRPLLRSSLEALMYLQYIVEDEDAYARRSLSWLFKHAENRIIQYEQVDPSTEQGKRFLKSWETGRWTSWRSPRSIPGISEARARLARIRKKRHFVEIAEACKQSTNKNWFSWFGGPGNLEQLAEHVRMGAEYQLLYRSWSAIAHPESPSALIKGSKADEPVYGHIRHPHHLQEACDFADQFMLSAIMLMLDKYRPGERDGEGFKRWYKREVAARQRKLHEFA